MKILPCLFPAFVSAIRGGAHATATTTGPVETSTAREVLDVVLPVNPQQFLRAFILDEGFTQSIFNSNGDRDVRVGAWAKSVDSVVRGGGGGQGTEMARELEYSHPVKTRFPGMPSHARTYKRQAYVYDGKTGVLEMTEDLRFEGIPKADYFQVRTEWTVRSSQQHSASEVSVRLSVVFKKNTILRGRIESSTFAEQGESLWAWISSARESLNPGGNPEDTKGPAARSSGRFRFPFSWPGGVSSACPSDGDTVALGGARETLAHKFGGMWRHFKRPWRGGKKEGQEDNGCIATAQ